MDLPIDKIICGDAATTLRQFPDKSVNLVITSPPYFQQREYAGGQIGSENKVERYIDAIIEVFYESVRIVKDDGSIVFNIGDKYQNSSLLLVPFRFALRALETKGVKLVNNITWVKSNPTPRQFQRRLVNSTEPFFHFVKTNDYYYDIDAFQSIDIKEQDEDKQKSLTFASKESRIGESYKELISASELTPKEKVYANKALDEVIQEVKDRDIVGFRMKIRGIHSPAFGGQAGGRAIQIEKQGFTIIRMYGKKLKKDVIISPVETSKGVRHPAVYPQQIIEELIKLLTRPKDIVLDPFIGSGTSAVAAKKLSRHYIGIDINPEYCNMTDERLKNTPSIRGIGYDRK
jgi:site-specific DNA-methyltransferase (adenine-specific)